MVAGKVFAGVYKKILLKSVLLIIKLFVPSVERDKLFMSAAFENLARFDHQDLIGAAYRRQTVGDHKGRPPLAKPV